MSYGPQMYRTYAKKYFIYSKLHEEYNGDPLTLWIHFFGLQELDKFAKPPKKVNKTSKCPKSAKRVRFQLSGIIFHGLTQKVDLKWP